MIPASNTRGGKEATFPSDDKAIVIDANLEKTYMDYAIAVGDLVGRENVQYVSNQMHDYVCLHLSDKSLVEKLVADRAEVNIDGHKLEIQSLASKAKSVVISNVYPRVPNTSLEEAFRKMGIKPFSRIVRIKTDSGAPKLKPTLSYKRQVYLRLEDVEKLPTDLWLPYDQDSSDEQDYTVTFCLEKPTDFLCKEVGHQYRPFEESEVYDWHTLNLSTTSVEK